MEKDFENEKIEEQGNTKYISKFMKNSYIEGDYEVDSSEIRKHTNYKYTEEIEDVIETKKNEEKALMIHQWITEHEFDTDNIIYCVKGINEYIKHVEYKNATEIIMLMFEFYCLDYDVAIKYVPQKIRLDIVEHLKKNHFYKPKLEILEL